MANDPPPPAPGPRRPVGDRTAAGASAPPGYGHPPPAGYQPPRAGGVPVPPVDPTVAEWWQRLVARLIDGLVLFVILSPLQVAYFVWLIRQMARLPMAVTGPGQQPPDLTSAWLSMEEKSLLWGTVLAAAFAVVGWCYDALQHGRWGQTLGKRALKIEVVGSDRAALSGAAAAKRAVAYPLAGIVPMIGGTFAMIDALWLLWDRPYRQCLHDKFAGSVVVKTVPPVAPYPHPEMAVPK